MELHNGGDMKFNIKHIPKNKATKSEVYHTLKNLGVDIYNDYVINAKERYENGANFDSVIVLDGEIVLCVEYRISISKNPMVDLGKSRKKINVNTLITTSKDEPDKIINFIIKEKWKLTKEPSLYFFAGDEISYINFV